MCSSSIADLLVLTANTGIFGKAISSSKGINARDYFVQYCRIDKAWWFLRSSESMSPSGCSDSDFVYTRTVILDHTWLTDVLTSKFLGNKLTLISVTIIIFSLFSVNWLMSLQTSLWAGSWLLHTTAVPSRSTSIQQHQREEKKGEKKFLSDYGSSKAPPLCVCTITACCSTNCATPETLTLHNNLSWPKNSIKSRQ